MSVQSFPALLRRVFPARAFLSTAVGGLLLAGAAPALEAQTAHFSYAQSTIASGLNSPAGLATDSSGNLYIAVPGAGEVLKETLSAGSYTQNAILTGQNDPYGVAVDSSGNLYIACLGDSSGDAGLGTLIEATPSGNSYSTNTLLTGLNDPTGIAVDSSGDLYLAERSLSQAAGTGVVVKETLAGNTYTQSSIATGLNYPTGLALDTSGNVYIAVQGNGVNTGSLLEVPAAGGTPTAILTGVTFNDVSAVAVDSSGNVYVAAPAGSNFQLLVEAPQSGNTWTQSLAVGGLSNPSGLAIDGNGNISISDTGNNQVLKVQTRSTDFGSANVATTTPLAETLTFTFDSAGRLNSTTPFQVVTQGAAGLDFQAAGTQEANACNGTTSYSTGDTCTIDVSFAPQYAGTRTGAVQLINSSGAAIATSSGYGIGTGPVAVFLPGIQTTLATGLSAPAGVAVDGRGDIIFSNYGAHDVQMIPAGGGTPVTVTTAFSGPAGLAVDGSGNVFVADFPANSLREILAVNGVVSGSSSVITLPATVNGCTGVAIDGSGNLFVAEQNGAAVLEVVAPDYTTTRTLGSGFNTPENAAVDSTGNVFVADEAGSVLEILAPSYTTVKTLASGLSSPNGIAVDAGDDVYVTGGTSSSDSYLYQYTPSGGSYTQSTLGSGLNGPQALGLDGKGDIYIADFVNGALEEIVRTGAPSLSFATTNVGATSSDSPQTVTLANIGNAALTFPIPASGQNPSIAANFALNSSATCPTVDSSSSSPGTLAGGSICTLAVEFSPAEAGTIGGSLKLTDDSLNAAGPNYTTQTINLSGTADAVVPGAPTIGTATAGDTQATVSFTAPLFTGGSAITGYTVTANPSGITGTCAASPCTVTGLTNGISFTFTITATNSVGTGTASAASNSVTPAVSQAITFNNPGTQTFGTSPTLTASASSGLPVTFTSSTTAVCTVTSTGALTFVNAGTCTINADQGGNGVFLPASRVSQSFNVNQAVVQVTLTGLSATYTGAPIAAAASTTPAGLSLSLTYNGSATLPVAAGSYTVVATITDPNDQGSATGTLVIAKATPTVGWTAPASIPYGTALSPAQLDATASVPGTFTYTPAAGTILLSGTHTLSVTFAPANTTDYATPAAVTTTATVTPATLTITANNATRVYGTANPAFTGAVSGTINGDSFTESFSTTATQSSAAGTYAIVPSVNGGDLGAYSVAATNGTLTVVQAATTTALSASGSSLTPGQSLTLTAQIADATAASTGMPTGTVSFYDGTTLLGTAPLNSGTASYTVASLAPGMTHPISASYAGDGNFTASSSSTTLSVPVAALSYSLALSGATSQTVIPGGAVGYAFQISPTYGSYPGPVTFAASGLPAGATAVFSPATIAASAGPQNVIMTIQTEASSTAAQNGNLMEHGGSLLAFGVLVLPFAGMRRLRRTLLGRGALLSLLFAVAAAAAISLSGCGAANSFHEQTVKNYTITVAASSGGVQQSFAVTLNLQ
ncbi:MAG TPA: MBG domain-containing protein [Acidobacteriaceae bacterium]|jgi:sugar lactone lactonase YvrE|nr:MBG domain-containing protein [Acidobacteriaceae bacterium]